MMKELQKRPLVRPLLFWITGICLYVYTPYVWVTLSLLIIVLLFSLFSSSTVEPKYRDRWQWGVLFFILVVSLAVLMSAYRDSLSSNAVASPILEWAVTLKDRLLSRLNQLNLQPSEKAVLATLLLGDASTIDYAIRQQFSVTGVAHILSVSGFHVAVVCGFYTSLLQIFPFSRLPRYFKYLSTMCLLWGFTLITGWAIPSIRAALMLTFFLTGRLIGRSTDSYNTLAASALLTLLVDPFSLFDVGFQLSYVAVLFILLLMPRLNHMLSIRNPLLATPLSWVNISIAAQAGTAFLCLYYFSQFPVLFLFVNLPFTLVSSILIPCGLLYLLFPIGMPGYALLGASIEYQIRILLYLVDSFSRIPWAAFILPFDFVDLLLSYTSLALFLIYLSRKRPLYLLLSLNFLALLLLKLLLEYLWLPSI
jgi:competence protein ComEC